MLRQTNVRTALFLSAWLALLSSHVSGPVGRAALQGGCSKVNITPPLGIPLIGSKGEPSDAVMDELFAKAMVLDDGVTAIAIISADLLYVPLEEISGPVRKLIYERTGIPERNVMVCATHTHSGPEVFTRSKLAPQDEDAASQIDRSYLQTLIRKMADTVQIAWRNRQEVRIGLTIGRLPETLYNRRPRTDSGQAQMAFTLPAQVAATRKIETSGQGETRVLFPSFSEEANLTFGPIDPDVPILRMEDQDGKIVGSLMAWGCHPVCIYPHVSTAISADYPAFASRVVETTEGGVSLFVLGLAGNTVPVQRGARACARIGTALGGEALRRLQLVDGTDEVTLRTLTKEIRLPTKRTAASDDSADDATGDDVVTEMQALKLGETCILGLPGEVLVEVGLAIKQRAGIEDLVVVTLANDAIGYVCHRQAYEEGGYEPGPGTHLASGAGEIMIEQALVLLEEIDRSGPDDAIGSPSLR